MKAPCEAVAVRYVHDVRTGEFLNIGVVLMSLGHVFAGARFLAHWGRVTAAFPGADPVHLRRVAHALEQACDSWVAASQQLDLVERVDDLTKLIRSAIELDDASIQFSPPITGVTPDPRVTLDELYEAYAGRLSEPEARPSRDDADVWRGFVRRLAKPEILVHLQPHVLETSHYVLSFDHAWRNGQWNATQPLSLDLLDPGRIRDKATAWTGKLMTVQPSAFDTQVYFLVGMPGAQSPRAIRTAADDAVAILEDKLAGEAHVLTEDRGEELARKLASDIAAHKTHG
jgi:hypothetical protein